MQRYEEVMENERRIRIIKAHLVSRTFHSLLCDSLYTLIFFVRTQDHERRRFDIITREMRNCNMQDPNDNEMTNALCHAYQKTKNELAKVEHTFKSMVSKLHLDDDNNTTRSERSSADTCIIS